jgi:hypothetical protein
LFDGQMTERPKPIGFWIFNARPAAQKIPYIDVELQKGTTPLVKKLDGLYTRNFTNFRHDGIAKEDYEGPRTLLGNQYKLVINGEGPTPSKELFDIRQDPAEKNNLIDRQPETAAQMEQQLRDWQESVLKSLTEADYQ